MSQQELAPKREIFGWAMFDFANQGYTLLIITVIYGDLFTRIIVGDAPDFRMGNLLWSLALAISYLMVVVANPVCGAIMDYTASRKRFLFGSYLLTVFATAMLYLAEPGWWLVAVVLIIISNFAYAIGEGFIASFRLGPGLYWRAGRHGFRTVFSGGCIRRELRHHSLGWTLCGGFLSDHGHSHLCLGQGARQGPGQTGRRVAGENRGTANQDYLV